MKRGDIIQSKIVEGLSYTLINCDGRPLFIANERALVGGFVKPAAQLWELIEDVDVVYNIIESWND